MVTLSVCLPIYNASAVLGATLDSLFRQTFQDFEVIIVDNNSTDDTDAVVARYPDSRLRYFKNETNIGFPANLERCRTLASGRFVYLLASDDILSPAALELTCRAFEAHEDVGIVTRPYYWFEDEIPERAIRVVLPLDQNIDRVVSIHDSPGIFSKVMESVGQITGLAYRAELIDRSFHCDVFTTHIHMFLSIWRRHRAVFLKDYVVAVRTSSSQTRKVASIYELSPTLSWINMFDEVLVGDEFRKQRRWGREHICKNIEGLVQLRCFAPFRYFVREAAILIRHRVANLWYPKFWSYFLVLLLTPRPLLVRMVDRIKHILYASLVRDVRLAERP